MFYPSSFTSHSRSSVFRILPLGFRGSASTFLGEAPPFEALQPLIVIGGVYSILCFLLFDYVLDE